MISIAVHHTNLDLSPSTSFEWVRTNPLFLDNIDLQADRSFNFKIPRTANNERLLNDTNRISGCKLFVNGKLFANTVLHILGRDKAYFDISLVAELLKVDSSIKLPELVWNEVDVSTGVFAIKDTANTTDSDFVFPWIQNDDGSAFRALNTIYNLYFAAFYINQETTNILGQRQDVLCPLFKLNYVIDQVSSQLFSLEYAGNIRPMLSDFIIYNTTVLNRLYDPFIFKVERNSNTLTFTILSRDEFNIAIGDELRVGLNALNLSNQFQFKSVSYIITSADIDTDGKVKVNVFFNNFIAAIQSAALQTPNLLIDSTSEQPYFSFGPASHQHREDVIYVSLKKTIANSFDNISATNHLPNITAIEFLQAIKDFFCLSIIPNYTEKRLYFVHRETLLYTNKYKDYTSKLLEYDQEKIREAQNIRFVYTNDSSDEWTKDSSIYRSHANNHPEHSARDYQEFTINCATTATTIKSVSSPIAVYSFYIPLTKQPINDVPSNEGNFTLRLLKWKGISNFSGATEQAIIADDETLNPNSAFNNWWKDWYTFFKSGIKTKTFEMLLSANDILGLNPEYKWKIKHHHYLWSEIRTKVSMMHGIEISEVDAVKVKYPQECNLGSEQIVTELQQEETIGDG